MTTTMTKKTADEALADYPVRLPITVQWGDMDAFQHVNNVVYFRWFESARMRLFEAIGFTGSDVVGPILHSTSCRYRAPIYYPDALVAGPASSRSAAIASRWRWRCSAATQVLSLRRARR